MKSTESSTPADTARQLREIAAGADGECWGPWEDVSEILLEAAALLTASERPPITDNDKRWRFLEHGCQWVSWIPAGGDQVSFDPRQATGFAGDLNDMRGQADIEIRKQLAILRDGARELERKHGK